MDWPTGCTPSGSGILIRWGRGKHRKSEKLDLPHSDKGKRTAARIRAERIKEQRFGVTRVTRAKETRQTNATLFFEVCQRWLRTMSKEKGWSQATYDEYKISLNRYWIPAFHDRHIDTITYEDCDELWESFEFKTQKTAKNVLVPFKGVMQFAYRKNLIEEDLGTRFSVVGSQKPEIDPFTVDEKEAILKALAKMTAKDPTNEVAEVYWLTIADTGMRTPSEGIGLTWPDFDGKAFQVHSTVVRRKLADRTKTKSTRRVVCTPRLRERLSTFSTRWTNKGGHIFLNQAGTHFKDAKWLNDRFFQACELAEVRKRRPYNLRHSYASHALAAENRPRPALIAKHLGHSLEMFYRRYAKDIDGRDDDQELLAAFNQQANPDTEAKDQS
jgi:integrase